MRKALIAFSEALSDDNVEMWKLILVGIVSVCLLGIAWASMLWGAVVVLCLIGDYLKGGL